MGEAKPADPSRPADGNPRVVPFGARSQPVRTAPDREGVSWSAFAITVALAVFALAALIVQTQRVGALADQIEGLETQLSAANTQLATYHTQLGLIQTSVSAVVDQVTSLNELVQANPFATRPTAEAPPEPPTEQ